MKSGPVEPLEAWKPQRSSQVSITRWQTLEKVSWLLEKESIQSVVLAQFPQLPFIGTTLRSREAVCQVVCAAGLFPRASDRC